jgi:hypothetical protein
MPIFSPGGSLLLPLQTLLAGYTFDRLDYSGSIDERFSTQLRDQLPDFILDNYPLFESFLRSYFEWTEIYGNTRSEAVRLETYKDVDDTLDKFLDYFRSTFLTNLPRELANGINEKSLIKNIGYLYRSKGTKASFDLLFRILFNTTVDVEYPKDRILKPSTSTFDDRKYIRVLTPLSIEQMKEMENTIIVQRSTQNERVLATALVDKVKFVSKGGLDYYSLTLQTVSGEFDSNIKILLTPRGSVDGIPAKIIPTLTSVQINAGGSGYQVGDELVVRDIYNNDLLRGYVDSVGPNNGIRGFNYTDNFGVYTNNSGFTYSITTVGGVGASLVASSEEVISDGPDAYLDDSGKLSGRSFVQDNFFYQDFSYVLTVDRALQKFSNAIKNLIHPAGTQLFARYKNEVNFDQITTIDPSLNGESTAFNRMADQSSSNLSFFLPIVGHYLPHTFGTTIDPRGFTFETGSGATHYDFYPRGYNGQDGRTASDFYSTKIASSDYGTPHVNPVNGITHDPYYIKTLAPGLTLFDNVETTRILVNGAIGSTGYVGATVDLSGEGVGLFGFFPVGSSRTNTIAGGTLFGDGITHYGGYTAPQTTGYTVGISGGQIIQVRGTDSATSDFWIVYRHPNSLELSGITQIGRHAVVEIGVLPVFDTATSITASHGDRSGYARTIQNSGVSLNAGATFAVGEIVRQRRYNEPEAIGRVLRFRASSYQQNLPDGSSGPDGLLGTPYWNVGVDYLTVEVLNGTFTPYEDSTGTQRPVVGDDNGCSRLISGDSTPPKYSSITHEVSWTDIPISLIVNEIPYTVYE